MKSVIAILFAFLFASSAAFAPTMIIGKKAAAAPSTPASKTKQKKKVEFLYEDGLTDIERKQRVTQPGFLTGSAKSSIDESSINAEYADIGEFNLSQSQTLVISSVILFTLIAIVNAI